MGQHHRRSATSDVVWDIMFEWLFNKVYGAVAELFMFIDQSATDLFSLAWVRTFVSLFQALGWMLFVCGLVMAVFDTAMAYESGAANIRQTCVNVIKGFMAAALFAVVPQRLYELCIALQGSFSYDLLGVFLSDTYSTIADSGLSVLYVLASDVSLFSLFFIILFGYCTVKVVFANIKRGGIMLCQIAVGSIYDRHSQRLYRRLFKLVQTSDIDLSYSLFADCDTLSRIADLHSAPSYCSGHLPVSY